MFNLDDAIQAVNKPHRVHFEVLPVGYGMLGWKVTKDGERIAWFMTKREAISYAMTTCGGLWYRTDQDCQMLIKGRNGQIQDERTYGNDPEESKG